MARMEIISGTERRRRWSDEAKLRILEEADEPGAHIGDVARRMIFIRARSAYGASHSAMWSDRRCSSRWKSPSKAATNDGKGNCKPGDQDAHTMLRLFFSLGARSGNLSAAPPIRLFMLI